MTRTNRRRFLTITAGFAAAAAAAGLGPRPAQAAVFAWQGTALGARARILIDHPDAAAITADAAAEIARLEAIFSLYRADSALSRLNAEGRLAAPPFELLQCLALCDSVHAATGGLFDPTVQPLWALYATRFSAGSTPDAAAIAATLPLVNWRGVAFDPGAIVLQKGQALTLNGVAQGFIADKVAELLAARGLTDILIDTGELRALGHGPDGQPWAVALTTGGSLGLAERSLASSSALGTTFDAAGAVGHILNPVTGLPAAARWSLVSISAGSAGLADALSTAACLMADRATITAALGQFAGARLDHLG